MYAHAFTEKDVQEWLDRQRKRYQESGFGLWAMILQDTGAMIGQAGLTLQPYKNTWIPEIGYLLKRNTGAAATPKKPRQAAGIMPSGS